MHTPPAATTNPTHPTPILAPSQLTVSRHVAPTRVRELKVRFSSSMRRLPSPHFLSARRRYRRRWTKLRRATPRWSTRHRPRPLLCRAPLTTQEHSMHTSRRSRLVHPFTAQRRPRQRRPPSPPDTLAARSTVACPAVSRLINAPFLQIPTHPSFPNSFPDSLTRTSAEILPLTPSVFPPRP